MVPYPKRLIEVDLPIREISSHARREKSIRHGHISTLHIWWARRPLAACRAVLCASLWPDPVDEACPQGFRDAVAVAICYFADQVQHDEKLAMLCKNHWTRWIRTNPTTLRSSDPACWAEMRFALLDFIADFANWDASTSPAFLDTARLLTQAAHLTLSEMWPVEHKDIPRTSISDALKYLASQIKDYPRPLVVDPFAGGGAIPLEALRVGADAFASDLNPVAVLLNKVVLEYIPKYGNARIESKDAEGNPIVFNGLAEAVQYWGIWIKEKAEKELKQFYPSNVQAPSAYLPQIEQLRKNDGEKWGLVSVADEKPVAYLWARTITCEGPGCGVEVPLFRSLWLAKKRDRLVALQIVLDRKNKHIGFELIENQNGKWIGRSKSSTEIKNPVFDGTVRRGSVTCPYCGYTTPVEKVREQLRARDGGTDDARLVALVCVIKSKRSYGERTDIFDESGRFFRLASPEEALVVNRAKSMLDSIQLNYSGEISIVPNEETPNNQSHRAVGSVSIYGMKSWRNIFTIRQTLLLVTLVKLLNEIDKNFIDKGPLDATKSILACAIDREAEHSTSLCRWNSSGLKIQATFGRQALPMLWDFAEANPFGGSVGSWDTMLEIVQIPFETILSINNCGHGSQLDATQHVLPDDSAQGFITDPPYYDAVPYAELSDFFFVWLKRSLSKNLSDLFRQNLTPKKEQATVNHPSSHQEKHEFENKMFLAMSEGRRILLPSGIGIVVFANKTTSGWEAQLEAMLKAGWIITGSWPLDTEMETRMNAMDTASLASSIHLVCRPRETTDGILIVEIGDWRDVLNELPGRIHSWLPRLANEGIVGADAIFACLGPALEIFSRYSHVEKASGEVVTLKEYLEVVWAAVSREAMSVIFEGADATGFEEDARLTAMWLWTLSGNKPESQPNGNDSAETEETDEETSTKTNGSGSHYVLEYDTARKIAQGLGAHLERLNSLVELKGDQARLLSVSERAGSLFGQEENPLQDARKKAASSQLSLFSLMVTPDGSSAEGEWQEDRIQAGQTTLDQIHQAMLLFGAGRSAALKRFLVDDGIGKAERFWRLAQALSALYPSSSEEKRWVDGVLAKKKGLGF